MNMTENTKKRWHITATSARKNIGVCLGRKSPRDKFSLLLAICLCSLGREVAAISSPTRHATTLALCNRSAFATPPSGGRDQKWLPTLRLRVGNLCEGTV